jgi:hypothetical protein
MEPFKVIRNWLTGAVVRKNLDVKTLGVAKGK